MTKAISVEEVARALVAPGRGILAADESTGTIKKRFDAIKAENTEENRRAYREMLFTAPGIAEHISGVIMYDETLRQKTRAGVPFAELLAKQGIVPGIKVDAGAKPLAGFPRETITEGPGGGREPVCGLPGRDDHGGSRRAARAARGVLQARCAFREVAGRDRHRCRGT